MATVTAAEPITLSGVDWATYCRLRDQEGNDPIRMSYLDGELTLMSPEYLHDEGSSVLEVFLRSVTSALGLEIKGIRSTTLRLDLKSAGKEPDLAFYLGDNERRMRGAKSLDLAVDPPPDLAIEVENTRAAKAALAIYARLGVPEVWRYDVRGRSLWFGRLAGKRYRSIDRSQVLPMLTPPLVLGAIVVLDEGGMGENAWSEWLKGWARGLPPAP